MESEAVAKLHALTDRELWLVTARAGSRQSGLIATFVNQASIVPDLPRVLVGLSHQHYTWELVEASGAFGLHLLGEEHLDWVWRFGLRSGRDADKFAGLTIHTAATGSPLLADALGRMDCQVETRMETGDRTVYLAEVVAAQLLRAAPPLTLRRVLQLAAPEQLRELKAQLASDGALDAKAIRAWRDARSRPAPP